MKVIKTDLVGVYILEPQVFGDHRGWFSETWSRRDFEDTGLNYDFVQDNHSYSAHKGTLRGLHFQRGDASQAKLVRCTRGAIRDVAVDLRHESETYLQWTAVELSAENHRELLIPRGFAHGFVTLTDDVEFLYRVDNFYAPETEGCIRYDDPDLAVDWGLDPGVQPILAAKDAAAPYVSELGILF